jgi:Lamin Tail Domain
LTKPLSNRQESSTASFREFIDHQLATNEAASLFVPDSARVVRLDSVVPDYGKTTSDHFPVMSRLALGNRPPPPPPTGGKPLINEELANEPGAAQAGEFAEIVNAGEGTADLAGFALSDGTSVRHVFGTGTTLGLGERLADFDNADGIAPGAGRSVASSTGGLSLNNTGDALTLRDASGATVDSFTYAASLASSATRPERARSGGSGSASTLQRSVPSESEASSSSPKVRGAGLRTATTKLALPPCTVARSNESASSARAPRGTGAGSGSGLGRGAGAGETTMCGGG